MQEHIVMLPEEVLATPFGQMIAPMLVGPGSLQATLGSVRQEMPSPLPALASPGPAATTATSTAGALTSEPAVSPVLPASSTPSDVPSRADEAFSKGSGDREEGRNNGPALKAAHHALEIATAAAALEEAAEVEGLTAPTGFAAASVALQPVATVVSEQPGTSVRAPELGGADSQLAQESNPLEGGQDTGEVEGVEGHLPAGQQESSSSGGAQKQGAELEKTAQSGQATRPAAETAQEGPGSSGESQHRARFEAAVRAEFAALMALGSMSANQAAILALQRVRARSVAGASVRA